MTRLPVVLDRTDLPIAELCALRLDGELFAVDEAFAPIDYPDDALRRAGSLALLSQNRFIAEQRSAAWIWGASDAPPKRHELCASIGARGRSSYPHRVVVREVVITERDYAVLSGQRVTTPLRTVIDLARFSDEFDRQLISRLLALSSLTIDDCLAELARRRNLPRKRRAIQRLSSYPELTLYTS